jgi:hypothetical protein
MLFFLILTLLGKLRTPPRSRLALCYERRFHLSSIRSKNFTRNYC